MDLLHEDKILHDKYPDKYKLFLDYYNNYTILGMFGAFLKRMRRHKVYPKRNRYAPVYSLDNGNVIYMMKFYVLKNNDVKIIKINNVTNTVESIVVGNIMESWEMYKQMIMDTFITNG